MTKGEINSLQTLAKAGGGSLTVNPHTGLAEAGFLSKLLPMAIGGAAMYFSGGTINPATIGMLTGGLQYARTGSLNQGLMAGLGAYGGAGLAGGLMGAGVANAGAGATANALGVEGAATGAGSQASMLAQQNAGFGQAGLESLGKSAAVANGATPVVQTAGQSMLSGVQGLGSEAGRGAFMNQMGGGAGLMKTGLAAAAPMMMGGQQPETPVGDSTMPQRLKYNPGAAATTPMPDVPEYGNLGGDFGRQRSYFPDAGYEQITPEEAKKIRGYAGGGPVEQMSNANAIGANTGYPMANVNKATYATPYQTPISQNVVQGAADTGVNSMTGEMNEFADGGITGSGNLDLSIPLNFGGGAGGANGYQAAGSGGNQQKQNSLGVTQPQENPFAQQNPSMSHVMPQQMQQDPFAGDTNWANYQNQMQGMVKDFEGSDQFKNMKSLQETMANYQRQRMGAMNPVSAAQGPESRMALLANGGLSSAYAAGGMSHLGDYSDGGRLLKGPGDGVSDSIPATIGNKRPARLADGEFVVPARIVSELGNGSTEAGARKLYAMLDRVQSARKKSMGKGKVAKNSRADKLLPA
jgi:hypothetical protein